MNKTVAIILGVVLLIGVWVFGTFNNLVTKETQIDGQWAQVETQYQRRYDLIPNLVSSTQGFLKQEKTIFEEIAKARTAYGDARGLNEKVQAAGQLESALGRLLVIVENYPNLKSNETVAKLMDELAGTENRISVERKRFNELIQDYNATIRRMPTSFVAGSFGFNQKLYFQSVEGSEEAPKVEL